MDIQQQSTVYSLFLASMRAGVIHIAFCLTAVVAFAFAATLPQVLGVAILTIGTVVVFFDFYQRSHFLISLSLLLVAVLTVAAAIG
jgi:hypothetical protein